jgi:hypothetical protein
MGRKLTVCFAVILLVSPVFAVLSFAQVDPEKVLVGTWEGQIEATLTSGNQRVLLINSIKKTDTGWLALARFSRPREVNREAQGGRAVYVIEKDNEIILEFPYQEGWTDPMRLKLIGTNKLEGTVNMTQRNERRPTDKRLKLEKLASGATD